MKSKWLIGVALLSLAAGAQAHTRLEASVPAEGSVVTASPSNIVLNFSAPARVTVLTLQKEGESEQKLSPLPTDMAPQVSVPAPKLAPGAYVVTWRVVSDDNHVMSGKLHFTVAAPVKDAAAMRSPAN